MRSVGLFLILTAMMLGAPGLAAAEGELDLRISAEKTEFAPGEPIPLTFNVTNESGGACGIAMSDAGTVRVIALRRDGQTLRPALTRSLYLNGIRSGIAASLRTAEPGSAVRVAVTGTRIREGDAADSVVIQSVSATASGGGLDALWPVGEPGRYELTATYAIPEIGGSRCAGTTSAQTVTFTVGGGGPPMWLLAGGIALAVLVLGVLVVVLVRRSAGRAVVVLMIVGAGVIAGPSPRAAAELIIDESLVTAVNGCLTKFRQVASGSSRLARETARMLAQVESKENLPVTIKPTIGESVTKPVPNPDPIMTPEEAAKQPAGSTIYWDPNWKEPFTGEPNVNVDPCAALFHEWVHADDNSRGTYDGSPCGGTGITKAEVKATLAENAYRAAQKPKLDARKTYDGNTLPKSLADCDKKPEKKPPKGPKKMCASIAGQCAGSYGDPHLMTFDQLDYDFQAVGEFVLTRGEGLEVQARQAPFAGWTPGTVSVTSAVAAKVGESRLNLVFDNDVAVRIDGAEVDPERGERALPGGGTLVRQQSSSGFGPDTYIVRWPDGSAVELDTIGTWGLRVVMKLSPERIGAVEGLYGDFDGDPANDLTPAGGDSLGTEPEFEPLHRVFGDSWRVRDDTSLFDYGPGESTETFTDRSFPEKQVTVDDLDPGQRAEAESICREAGVTAPRLLTGCVLDVAVTGQPDFAVASADTELVAPPAPSITAPPVATATLTDADRLTFTGKAGQVVFVDLAASTLPNDCGAAKLLDPTGDELNGGCVIDGNGYIDRTELPSNGEYTVELDTGRALARVYEVVDDTGSITPDGQAETVTLTHPGSVGRLTFTGRAGQTVFVDAPSSSLPNQCSPLRLVGPDGKDLNSGCLITGDGYIDATTLEADGRHTVLVDPRDDFVGETELRLTLADNQTGPIAIDGQPVRATVRQPGATSVFEFQGRAGQQLRLDGSDGTLPDQCGTIAVVGPNSRPVFTGCVINGTSSDEVTLRTDGVHRVVVDPNNRATGALTLHLTG